ncbi:transcription factor [Paraconiothyrium brasiliense]|uniref:Transcription factor n=1 Tax=Paraconiothyrium brasiliense TaxID=300254 RepID=A0ABR3QUK7_9PLEO
MTASNHFKFLGHAEILSSKAVELGKEHPIVMHAMLALSACHLQGLGCRTQPYRMTETFHCQHAIRGLQKAVVSFNGVEEADSVLTTSMLLNSLVSSSEEYLSYSQDTGELQWGWLRFQIGITDLLMRTKPFHPQSIWLPMFLSSKQPLVIGDPCNELDRQLADFCAIEENSTAEDNPYFDFWKQLGPLVVRIPGPQYLRWYVEAVGGIDIRFINLLEEEDLPALMLFAHWVAMMCCLETWTITRRLSKICLKICEILRPRLKMSDLYLLHNPAKTVGFALHA